MPDLNSTFAELAQAFVASARGGTDIAHPEYLDPTLLDGTLKSLLEVDRYLAQLRLDPGQLNDRIWQATILRAGAYVGQVIRDAAAAGDYEWMEYGQYLRLHPQVQPTIPPDSASAHGMLVHRSGRICMPLDEIGSRLDEGNEYGVHFFAVCELKNVRRRPNP